MTGRRGTARVPSRRSAVAGLIGASAVVFLLFGLTRPPSADAAKSESSSPILEPRSIAADRDVEIDQFLGAEKTFRAWVETLASDRMEGRGLGTEGIERAADWIEARLRKIGLEPAFGDSYRQEFPVKIGVKLVEGNSLGWSRAFGEFLPVKAPPSSPPVGGAGPAKEKGPEPAPDADWIPLPFSSSGEFDGDLVFAGYGIDASEVGYREFEGLDIAGNVVLILRYEPQEKDDASPFDGKKPSRWSAMRYKVLQARERGAAAVVFTTGPLQDEGQDNLPVLRNDGPKSPAGIPVLQVKTSVAARWLEAAGVDLRAFQAAVDRDLAPRSLAETGVRLRGRVALDPIYTQAVNLAGVIPGRGALASDWVAVGAHYDHLGCGGEGSMRPNETAIHNGADDNASGTAAALLVGDALRRALAGSENHRSIVIALFSAEESGLAGSAHFVEHPPLPIDRASAMLNLDMVGRLREETLVALGTESAPEWSAAIDRAASRVAGLAVTGRGDGYGPSDHTSFYASGVPVLHLFTGAHEQHHTPEDTAEKLNVPGAVRVARFASEVVSDVALRPDRLTYRRSTEGPAMAGDSRGYGAYLGTIPDYRAMEAEEGGVLLADVRPGGPADLAGIRGGDRIVAMAGTRIENLYDMTYALQDNRPGETIEVVVEREAESLTLMATLGDREKMRSGEPTAGHGSGEGGGGHGAAETSAGHAAAPEPKHDAAPGRPETGAVEASRSQKAGSSPGSGSEGGPSGQHEASSGGPPENDSSGISPFYENRPGPDFEIHAGNPFPKTFEGERHLTDIRQLTFGGENAEAYFSPDGRSLIFQATTSDGGCDQEYLMDLATGETRLVSTGKGRTTCGYFDWPEADRVVFASTHEAGPDCPPPPDRSQGYVWGLYDSYDLFEALPDGTGFRRLTDTPGYDAEATWCHRGGKMVFTSVRDGDLDLYVRNEAGDVTRLTDSPGYDGGAFFSPDCTEIVWRASRPQGEALDDYRLLLARGLVRPGNLEIFLMDSDGGNVRQLTSNGAANFCPAFTADGRNIIYSSNAGSPDGREFDLWLIPKSGGAPERITTAPGFDGFPQFSPDGRLLVWSSNRADPTGGDTNLFLALWRN